MGKKYVSSKIGKGLIVVLVLTAILTSGKREGKKTDVNFYQIGFQVFKVYFERQMLSSQSVVTAMLWEQEQVTGYRVVDVKAEGFLPDYEQKHFLTVEEEMQERIREENQGKTQQKKEEVMISEESFFVPVSEKQVEIKEEDFWKEEEFLKKFYTIDPTTTVKEEELNFKKLLEEDCSVDSRKEGPQILIYHTHSQETFSDSEQGKEEDTIVGAGEILSSGTSFRATLTLPFRESPVTCAIKESTTATRSSFSDITPWRERGMPFSSTP